MADDWKHNVMDAVKRQNSAKLHQLLQNSDQQSVNYTIGRFSPLTEAVCRKNCNIIEQLLLAGGYVDFPNEWGETPLMITAQIIFGNIPDNIRRNELLLKYRANVNARNHMDGCLSVLCYPIRHDKDNSMTEIITLLLEHGAQIYDPSKALNDFSAQDSSPLYNVMEYKLPCRLEMFLDHSDKINERLPRAELFHVSLFKRSEDCAIMVLQQGYYPKSGILNISIWACFPDCFWFAAMSGYTSLMSLLVEINPHCLQSEWLISQDIPSKIAQNADFISLLVEARKQPSRLTQLCKPVVLAQLDNYYLRQGRIDELPLPKLLKIFLKKL